jgi:ATP-dependent protease ClpP protease subunit
MTKTWYNLKALNNSAAVLTIFSEIGSFGVSAAQFVQDLTNLGSITDLTVKINSPGGSVSDGVAIFNALKASPARVQVEIDGWALSIASFIAMAGDTITMASNSLLMIHNPWTTAAGNAADLRKMADVLDKTRNSLLAGYGRSGKSEADLIALLDAETWFDAEEALAAGFIDEIITTAAPIAASFDSNKFNVPSRYLLKGNTVSAAAPQPNNGVRDHILAQDTARRDAITSAFKSFANHTGVAALQAACLSDVNCSVLDANVKLLAHLGNGASPVAGHYIPDGAGGVDSRSADFKEACVQSLLIRAGVRVPDPSPMVRDVERMNITAMAESILSMSGQRTAALGRADLIKAAMSTSDFPQLLANTAGKALMLGYESEPTTHSIWTAEKEVANFKPQTFAALSEAPGLLEVPEGGEYKHGSFGEGAETFSIKTFGRVLSITRQALINDDLGAFTQMPAAFGASARRKEADLVYAKLTGNTMLSDNKALFHADHGNLAAAGAALSIESLGAARAAMRRQKGRAGEGYIDPQPRFLIVPVTLESKAESILNSLVLAGAMNDTNNLQWIRNLTLVADPRLDDVSATAWYLAASPTQLDTIVRAYLAGQPRPFYEEELEFMRDTMGIKSRLDFGCGVIDYRGLYKNPGA